MSIIENLKNLKRKDWIDEKTIEYMKIKAIWSSALEIWRQAAL
jgi:hypothetical protein